MKNFVCGLDFSFLSLSFLVLSACSDSTPTAPASAAASPAASPAPSVSCSDFKKTLVQTNHETTIGGKKISYTTTAGYLEVAIDSSANGSDPVSAKGCIFFSYYQVIPENAATARPLTFAYNGGPGSASLWLHLGALGPKRVDLGADGLKPVVPYKLVDNENSILDLSDLVMVDPIGTGFSKAEDSSKNEMFYGAKNDSNSIVIFIRNFLDSFDRRDSSLYLFGESYGGMRSSLVAHHMQTDYSIPLAGVVLISPWLSTTMGNFDVTSTSATGVTAPGLNDNDVTWFTYMPSYATIAWFHKKSAAKYLALDLETVYKEAKTFAFGKYRQALLAGSEIEPEEFHLVASMLSEFTGIPQRQIENWNLRIKDVQFINTLLADQSLELGVYDARITSKHLLEQDGNRATDPSNTSTGFTFVGAINAYLKNELQFKSDSPYVDTDNIKTWPMDSDGSDLSVTQDLSQAMADHTVIDQKPLPVFVASGYYDLSVPMGTVDYERSRLDPSVYKAMEIHRYPGGHMMYINPIALRQLKKDLTKFYEH